MKKQILSMLMILCVVMSLVPATVFAADGDTDITEVEIEGVSNELWSYRDMTFASVGEGANYTITEQKWYSSSETSITPDSENLKPKAGKEYTFSITLKADDGYVFPIKSESSVFYDGTFKLNGVEYSDGVITVASGGKTLTVILFLLTKVKGVTMQNASVGTESELTDALKNPDVESITLKNDIEITATLNITRTVTLDIYGYMLEMTGSGSVIKVEGGGHLTIIDSDPDAAHKFTPNADGLWALDETNGTKTVKGGVIYGGTGSSIGISVYGGGVYVEGGGTFTMNGGNIVGCTASATFQARGGGVYVEGGGTFTMDGGNIVGCTASTTFSARGGGVFVAEKGTFTMSGGSIAGCTAVGGYSYGGGIYNEGTVTLSDTAEIRDCHAKDSDGEAAYGGGISDNGRAFQISGNVRITGCTASGGKTDAVSMNTGSVISGGTFDGSVLNSGTISGGTFNGKVVNDYKITNGTFNGEVVNDGTISGGTFNGTVTNYGTITKGAISGVTLTYQLNGEDYVTQIVQSGNAATPIYPFVDAGQVFEGWLKADGTMWDFTTAVTENTTLTGWVYVPVTNETELEAALAKYTMNVIRLTDDVDIGSSLTILRKLTLDLNGHVLRQTADRCVSFKVEETGDLTIIDSNPTAPHKFTPNSDGLWVWDETGGTKTVHGGVITGNTAGNSGTIQIGGTVTMSAGNLVGCSAYNTPSGVAPSCGAVYVSANSKFVMNGGAIQGSFARIGDGGGVYVNGGQFTMNGGSITDCTVEHLGGGVYVNFGTFKLVDGYIRNCKADFGGGVCVRPNMVSGKDGIFEMSGGVISDCTAKTKGSALIIDGNQLDDTGYAIGGTMYAGGGTVDGTAYIIKYGKITAKGGMTGVTSFKKEVLTKAGSKIEYGLFYGNITGEGTVSDLTVTYMINGVEYAKQVLPSGVLATRPDDPTTMGYTFGGWNKADGTAWDYAKDTVTENITLYAKWIPHTYTVTFDSTGGSEVTTKTMTATYGEPLANMPVPRREGYVFLGWYDAMVGGKCYGDSDGNGTDAYDKEENITLYAQWAEAPSRMVRFNKCGGTMTDPVEVRHKLNTPIARPSDPTKVGYTFTGWYTDLTYTQLWNFDDWVTDEMMLYAGWKANRYTITFDTAGGSEIASITQDYGSTITTPANPTREGYTFIGWDVEIPETMPAENVTITAQWKINRYTITFDTAGGSKVDSITQDYGSTITAPANPTREGYTFIGWNREIPETMPAENITITAQWKDSEKPTGEITIDKNKWRSFLNKLTFGLFFADTQTVEITAADNSGRVSIGYFVTELDLSEADLRSTVFKEYEGSFNLEPNGKYIVYVMLTDESLNITYLRSDRVTLDNVSPLITGIENGKTYCETQTVTVTDENLDTVTVNGTAVTLDENGSFVLAPAKGEQKIVAADKARNSFEMTVTVNDGHTFGEWKSNGDSTHTRKCTVEDCQTGIQTENCTDADKNHICDYCGKTISNHEDTDNNHVCDYCGKTISNHKDTDSNHVCDYCEKIISNHKDADKNHICDYCEKVITNHEDTDNNHICNYCGKIITNHTGGKATCTEKAVCDICGKAYGELDATNHSNLKHIDAKAATKNSEGNTEYWYCEGCNKYYGDAAATKEIQKADTVIAKLPDNNQKSPKTGDTNNLALWIALLFVNGGVFATLTAKSKKIKSAGR